MIRINLLPVKEAQRALGRRRQVSVALLSGCVALLVMVVPFALQQRRLAVLDSEIGVLQTDIAKLDLQAKEVRDLDKKRAELNGKLKVIEDLKQRRVGPVRILADLGSSAPEKLWLVEFKDADGQAVISGLALDNQTIASFMRQLATSKYFYDVDLVETAQSEPIRLAGGAQQAEMVFKKFIVKARLDYRGEGGKLPPDAAQAAAKKTGT